MKKSLLLLCVAVMLSGCHHHEENEHHHESEEHGHHHDEDVKLLITAYNDAYELYAECTPLVAGQEGEMLIHLTCLNDFKPLTNGNLGVVMICNDKKVEVSATAPERAGIFHLHLTPPSAGSAKLIFSIGTADTTSELTYEAIVAPDPHEAIEEAEKSHHHSSSAITFSKEQSWKTDFATAFPQKMPFGQVIPAIAQIQPAQGNEAIVVAPTEGIVSLLSSNLFEGKEVTKGASLISIRSDQLIDDNLSLRVNEAYHNYETAKENYERAQSLIDQKIVSEKEFSQLKNNYENAKLVYDNLNKNYSAQGSTVRTPIGGFIQQLFVQNGSYVTTGQPLMTISQTQNLIIKAEIPQRYASMVSLLQDATIENPLSKKVYELSELGGKIISYGKSLSTNSLMLPITLQINNAGGFVPGSLVKIWLRTAATTPTLVIPKTALIEEQGNYFVWVQLTPELFDKQEVKIGVTDGKNVEIVSGITESQRIVVKGAVMVKLSKSSGALDPHAGHVH